MILTQSLAHKVTKKLMTSIRSNKGSEGGRRQDRILTPSHARFVVHPIEYPDLWDFYKKAVACFWTVEEIDFSRDKQQWLDKLSQDEREFLKMILAFFAASDGLVTENLAARFLNDVQISEARMFYGFQMAAENIHSETYSLMLTTLISDSAELGGLLNAVETIPAVKLKADWALKWIGGEDASFAQRLVAFACIEGIFFSGAFAAIFFFKKSGLMPGLCQSNELISRDEGMHTCFAVALYHHLDNKLSTESVHDILKEAMAIEEVFIRDAIPEDSKMMGMRPELMIQYVRYVCDHLAYELTQEKIFNVQNPFPWMDLISLEGKTNFFERRVSEYSRAGSIQKHVLTDFGSADADF